MAYACLKIRVIRCKQVITSITKLAAIKRAVRIRDFISLNSEEKRNRSVTKGA